MAEEKKSDKNSPKGYTGKCVFDYEELFSKKLTDWIESGDETKIDKLFDYLCLRAEQVEGIEFDEDFDKMVNQFDMGVREFFGVLIDDDGDFLEDTKYPMFFDSYTPDNE